MPKDQSAIDPRQIFDTAEGFREACALFDIAKDEGKAVLTLVMGMNASYSLEAYLKCLIFLEKCSFPETHDFAKLFGELNKQTQSELREQHKRDAANDPRFADALKEGIKTDLDSLLEIGKDSFVRFRYAFEGKSSHTVFGLGKLMRLVREKILKLRPEWNPPVSEAS